MFGICTLFCLILVNVISGTNGVGEEADNGNDKNDSLFGEMWRMAFEANRHNGKEAEEKEEMAKTKVKEEQKEEEMEKKGVVEESTKRVKEEQKEEDEEENKLWKKMKTEPIEDEEERDGKKWQNPIKKEPKIEKKEWEELVDKPQTLAEESDDQQLDKSASDQRDSDQSTADIEKKIESETDKLTDETKLEIIKSFDKKREEYKMRKEYNRKNYAKIELKIARELGKSRSKIYKWKRELIQKKEPESKERKRAIIEKFDKMKNENKNENGYRWKFDQKIAKELGTCRSTIYKWKKELRKSENEERKWGKREISNKKKEEEKWEIIENFDKMRKEHKMKGDYKREDRNKIEQEIAKALGESRGKIYKWKKEIQTQ